MGDLEIFSKCHPGNILETLFYLFGGCYRSIVTVFTAKDCNAAITFYFPVATIIVIRIHHVIFMWCLCGRSITMVIYSLGGFTNLGALHAVSVIINFMIGSPQKDWTVIANKFGRILRSYLSVAVSTWWSGDSLYINGVPPRLMGGNDFTCPKCIYIYTYILLLAGMSKNYIGFEHLQNSLTMFLSIPIQNITMFDLVFFPWRWGFSAELRGLVQRCEGCHDIMIGWGFVFALIYPIHIQYYSKSQIF
jgi:hypothetical protein